MYANLPHDSIVATLRTLQHFRAFLASECGQMRDPYQVADWADGADRLDKAAAQQRLTWLVNMAISRKGGSCLPINMATAGASLNHLGKPCRKEDADYQRGLRQDQNEINYPRLIIRSLRTPELATRFAERIAASRDCY